MKTTARLLIVIAVLFLVALIGRGTAEGKQADYGPPEPKSEAAPEQMVPKSWWLAERKKRKRLARYSIRVERQRNFARAVLRRQPRVSEAINLAAATYGYSSTLWRKADCETGGTFSPNSKNKHSSASGLFQFLDSTWASTPYAGFSVFSAYANALAAGWMHAHHRGGEWSCQ